MKKESLYKSIQQDIQTKILDGSYPSGHQLMPEHQLAEHYNVSRITIRNAMDNLVNSRLVERIRGKGTFVVDEEERVKSPPIAHPNVEEMRMSLIIPNLRDPHTSGIINGIYEEAEQKGFAVTIYQTHQDQRLEEQAISQSLKNQASGLIVYPIQKEMYNEEIIRLALTRFPAVLIDRSLEGININSVVTDNETASYDATRYLIEKGHRRIGFISPSLELAIPLQERYRGYARAHQEAGVDVVSGTVNPYEDVFRRMNVQSGDEDPDTAAFEQIVRKSEGITAFLCAEPLETKLLMRTLKKLGRKVPEDISIIGFDDLENAEFFAPPPTVVRQNSVEIGRRAFSIMEDLMGGEKEKRQSIRIEAELVIRESVREI